MRPPISVECPKCHKVVLAVRAGTYGWHGHQRQLLKCQVCSYRFAEPLPRAVVAIDETCIECLNPLGKHQGQPHPRGYHFTARAVAKAMVMAAKAGRANSYRAVGERIRADLQRVRYNHKTDATGNPRTTPPERQSSTLIADWVEAIAPVLWKEHGPRVWPEMIAIDELDVRGRSASAKRKARLMFPESSKPNPDQAAEDDEAKGDDLIGVPVADSKKRGGTRLFVILGAEGYPKGGKSAAWLFQGAPSGTDEAWLGFFAALDGRPRIIIGDAGYAWQRAARLMWSAPNTPELLVSEFHLAKMLDRHITRLDLSGDAGLVAAAKAAFSGPTEWALLMALLTPIAMSDDSLARWLRRWEHRIAVQVAGHATLDARRRTTGGIEQRLLLVKARISPRRWMFGNRERMNRLLMLICLDMRRDANERDWAATIRAHLLRVGGRPGKQRQIWDPGGLDPGGLKQKGSLRFKPPKQTVTTP